MLMGGIHPTTQRPDGLHSMGTATRRRSEDGDPGGACEIARADTPCLKRKGAAATTDVHCPRARACAAVTADVHCPGARARAAGTADIHLPRSKSMRQRSMDTRRWPGARACRSPTALANARCALGNTATPTSRAKRMACADVVRVTGNLPKPA